MKFEVVSLSRIKSEDKTQCYVNIISADGVPIAMKKEELKMQFESKKEAIKKIKQKDVHKAIYKNYLKIKKRSDLMKEVSFEGRKDRRKNKQIIN